MSYTRLAARRCARRPYGWRCAGRDRTPTDRNAPGGVRRGRMQTRVIVLAGSVLAALFWVGLLSLLWPPGAERGDEFLADLLLDRASERYPLTIQNLMWIVFFVGAGELFREVRDEQ